MLDEGRHDRRELRREPMADVLSRVGGKPAQWRGRLSAREAVEEGQHAVITDLAQGKKRGAFGEGVEVTLEKLHNGFGSAWVADLAEGNQDLPFDRRVDLAEEQLLD